MNKIEFEQAYAEFLRRNPKILALAIADPPATEAQLLLVENLCQLQLPEAYRAFLSEYGGGEFGYLTIYSADPHSDWFLPNHYHKLKRYLTDEFVPLSDDGTGGIYLLGKKTDSLHYLKSEGEIVAVKEFRDMYEFISRYAFNPA